MNLYNLFWCNLCSFIAILVKMNIMYSTAFFLIRRQFIEMREIDMLNAMDARKRQRRVFITVTARTWDDSCGGFILFPGSPQVQLSCLIMADDCVDEFVEEEGGTWRFGGGCAALLMLPDPILATHPWLARLHNNLYVESSWEYSVSPAGAWFWDWYATIQHNHSPSKPTLEIQIMANMSVNRTSVREDEEKDYFNSPSVRRLDMAFSLASGVS